MHMQVILNSLFARPGSAAIGEESSGTGLVNRLLQLWRGGREGKGGCCIEIQITVIVLACVVWRFFKQFGGVRKAAIRSAKAARSLGERQLRNLTASPLCALAFKLLKQPS